ncbi:MAG: 3-deoxy-D-manno-octulosonic acid transferase, partial [Fibrobacter sp.]|nr:3-deoxy-D-manno-octulosonic acid transferase [Fibrobacter sp.]
MHISTIARTMLGVLGLVASRVPSLETRFHLRARLDGPWPHGPFLWLHGASLGECRMLLSVAKCLKKDIPECPRILITTQKVEVLAYLKTLPSDIKFALAPADTPFSLSPFFSAVKPLALVLAENELWPGYLSTMRKLPLRSSVALVSGRFNRFIFPSLLSSIGFASMQTGSDLQRLQVASENQIQPSVIGGDWKLLSWARSGKEVAPPKDPVIDTAFLSMHFKEWTSLIKMILASVKRHESVAVIPRCLEEVQKFRDAFREHELSVVDYPLVQKGTVTLVTEFGLTPEILSKSAAAVVGGSFARGLGVHDFWEPLQFGLSTFVGPYAKGQKETVEALLREGVITRLRSAADYSLRRPADYNRIEKFLFHERE